MPSRSTQLGPEFMIPSQSTQLGPWKRYKRRADNVTISARLVQRDGVKLLEVKENRMPDFHCPNCQYLLTQRDTGAFPNFVLEPQLFHEAHKLADPEP